MEFDYLEKLNKWWNDGDFRFEVIAREYYEKNLSVFKNIKEKSIDILIGARRVGKTSILRSVINKLLDSGVDNKSIVYVTSEILERETDSLLDVVQKIAVSLNKSIDELTLLIDEVQDIKQWQKDVKLLYDNFKCKIVVTGSSSLLLKEGTSKLTGRFKLYEVLGLSFREFLQFKKYPIKKSNEYLHEYLEIGGYPEYVMSNDSQKLLNAIDSTLFRDLLSIYGIRNPAFLRDLLDYLAENVGNAISPVIVAKRMHINDSTVRFYLDYLRDVYMIYPCFKQSQSHRVTKSSLPKYYFNDTGFLGIKSMNTKSGALAENAVYLHLRRLSNYKEFVRIYYSKFEDIEVDFYSKDLDKYFEVKYRDEIKKEDLEKYMSLEKNITILSKKGFEDFGTNNMQDLNDFLLSE